MMKPNHRCARPAGRTVLLVAIVSLLLASLSLNSAEATTNEQHKDLKADATSVKTEQNVTIQTEAQTEQSFSRQQQQQGNSENSQPMGRSMEAAASSATGVRRGGRMLDLDHLAGDIGKDEKAAKERSLSGERQSRILSEDLPFAKLSSDKQKIDGRSKKLQGKPKKMAIKGFIPIMSLDGVLSGHDDDNNNNDDNEEETLPQESANEKVQNMLSNYGAQTSIGHASFGYQPISVNEQQQQQGSSSGGQWRQIPANGLADSSETARANRKLLATSNILSGLTGPKRFMSALTQAQHLQAGYPLQAPMNLPLSAPSGFLAAESGGGECICVPFFQCKNGYLSESQLSKSQLHQILGSQQHQQVGFGSSASGSSFGLAGAHQVPRALNLNANHQQQATPAMDVYQQQQQQQLAPSVSSFMSQLELQQRQQQLSNSNGNNNIKSANEQQFVNDIYDQLRKNIESENLEQQAQDSQQPAYLPLDERSKAGGQQNENSQQQSNATLETQERSLLSPLGRRQSSQPRCGIMRTCCKIPPHLLSPQHAHQRGQQNARLTQHLGAQSSLRPQYQFLQPNLGSQMQPQQQQQLFHYQPATSALIPSVHNHQLHQQQQAEQQLPGAMLDLPQQPAQLSQMQDLQALQRPTAGSLMAGRCGTRQTLGISGRVQNAQPAPGSESTAEFGEFPAHAAILKRLSPGDSLFVCSAVLVSNQWLATAAHCVRRHRPEELKVRLGEWDVSRDDEFYPFVEANIREIVIEPEFQSVSLVNDIALLRMDQTVDQQQMPHISPACLATPSEQFGGQRCWLAGWGKDAFGQSGAFQSTLRKVDLPVFSRHDCETALRYQTKLGRHFRLHQSAICAGGERGKDACEGDGGAGLYCTEPESGLTKVIGLVSWGVGCGQRGVPGVYTNLAHLYPWIESVIAASGEESLYLDRNGAGNGNGLTDNAFKSLVSERSNAVNNGTMAAVADEARSAGSRSSSSNSTTTSAESSPSALGDIESRAG